MSWQGLARWASVALTGPGTAPATVPVRECRHDEHPDAVHWHHGYGNRHWSYDGPVTDCPFSNKTTQWAKGAHLTAGDTQ